MAGAGGWGEVGRQCDSWEGINFEKSSYILRICVRIGMMGNVRAYKVGPRYLRTRWGARNPVYLRNRVSEIYAVWGELRHLMWCGVGYAIANPPYI